MAEKVARHDDAHALMLNLFHDLALRINGLGLMNFEPYRQKNPRPAPPAEAPGAPVSCRVGCPHAVILAEGAEPSGQKPDTPAQPQPMNADVSATSGCMCAQRVTRVLVRQPSVSAHPYDEELEGAWEESVGRCLGGIVRTHTDSKPRGAVQSPTSTTHQDCV